MADSVTKVLDDYDPVEAAAPPAPTPARKAEKEDDFVYSYPAAREEAAATGATGSATGAADAAAAIKAEGERVSKSTRHRKGTVSGGDMTEERVRKIVRSELRASRKQAPRPSVDQAHAVVRKQIAGLEGATGSTGATGAPAAEKPAVKEAPAAATGPTGAKAAVEEEEEEKEAPAEDGPEARARAEAQRSIAATGAGMADATDTSSDILRLIHAAMDGQEGTPLHAVSKKLHALQKELEAALGDEGEAYRHTLAAYHAHRRHLETQRQVAEGRNDRAKTCMHRTSSVVAEDEEELMANKALASQQVDTSSFDKHIRHLREHMAKLEVARETHARSHHSSRSDLDRAHELVLKAKRIADAQHRMQRLGPDENVEELESTLVELAATHGAAHEALEGAGVVAGDGRATSLLRRAAGKSGQRGGDGALEPAGEEQRRPRSLHHIMSRVRSLLGSMSESFAQQKAKLEKMLSAHHGMYQQYIDEARGHIEEFEKQRNTMVGTVERAAKRVKQLRNQIGKTKMEKSKCTQQHIAAQADADQIDKSLSTLEKHRKRAVKAHNAAIKGLSTQHSAAAKALSLVADSVGGLPDDIRRDVLASSGYKNEEGGKAAARL